MYDADTALQAYIKDVCKGTMRLDEKVIVDLITTR